MDYLLVALVAAGLVLVAARFGSAPLRRWLHRRLQAENNAAGLVPGGEELQAALGRGDTSAVQFLWDDAGDDWGARHVFVTTLCQASALDACASWAKREPGNAFAQLCLGHAALRQAWAVRTSQAGAQVDAESYQGWQRHLGQAETALRQATELSPEDPTPWAILVEVAMGQQRLEEVHAFLAEADRRCPGHYGAHAAAINATSARWLGSHELALQVAREAAQAAAPGSDAHTLPILAHLHVFQYIDGFDRDSAAADAYLRRPDVRTECERALAASLDAPERRASGSTNQARNVAAFYFYMVQDEQRARVLLHAIGDRWTPVPWTWGRGLSAAGAFDRAASELVGDRPTPSFV